MFCVFPVRCPFFGGGLGYEVAFRVDLHVSSEVPLFCGGFWFTRLRLGVVCGVSVTFGRRGSASTLPFGRSVHFFARSFHFKLTEPPC